MLDVFLGTLLANLVTLALVGGAWLAYEDWKDSQETTKPEENARANALGYDPYS